MLEGRPPGRRVFVAFLTPIFVGAAEDECRSDRERRDTHEERRLIDDLRELRERVQSHGKGQRAGDEDPPTRTEACRHHAAWRPLSDEEDRRKQEHTEDRVERDQPHRRERLYSPG
ncbi:MAG: hypothetical protein DMG02_34040 [Acidobacteria bacterium]|nr:MAG: hypothetical protein DMG02_34040 [Acidobacteriota bacterium]